MSTAPSVASTSIQPSSPAWSADLSLSSCSSLRRRESTCVPLAKPIAARRALTGGRDGSVIWSVLRCLDDLGQDPAGGGGVKEGDPRAAYAGARRLVDQPDALLAQAGQRRLDVVDPVGDMVQAGTALGHEAADGCVV